MTLRPLSPATSSSVRLFGAAPTRREFLATTSQVLAATILTPRLLGADSLVALPVRSPHAPEAYLRAAMPAADIRTLATYAVEAAKSAGASYADVRIAERHLLVANDIRNVSIATRFTYGVRSLVDGVWGFAYGRSPTADGVAQVARDATVNARLSAQLSGTVIGTSHRNAAASSAEWFPPPVATGEWQVPIRIDPFAVPIEQHVETMEALRKAVHSVPEVGGYGVNFHPTWIKETRVIAAMTGTLVTQSLHRVSFEASLHAMIGGNNIGIPISGLSSSSAGYEIMLAPELPDRVKSDAEQVVQLARLPRGEIDVGRYPVVFDGSVMGAFVGRVLGPSLELDRAVNRDIDRYGTSIFSPEGLGTPVASPLLTILGNRAVPSITAVQWDDEGAVAREHTVLEDGVLVDYHTDGETVGAVQGWYQRQNRPMQGNGCALAPDAENAVTVRLPHLVMSPSTSRMSLDDLCVDMRRGIVALHDSYVSADNQLTSGYVSGTNQLFEVARGKIVRRIKGSGLQFMTRKLLKGLTAVGDAASVCRSDHLTWKGVPWVVAFHDTSAPAALFKEIDVVSMRS
jgi:TldD protein